MGCRFRNAHFSNSVGDAELAPRASFGAYYPIQSFVMIQVLYDIIDSRTSKYPDSNP
jgi:hypothetical protein